MSFSTNNSNSLSSCKLLCDGRIPLCRQIEDSMVDLYSVFSYEVGLYMPAALS